MMLQETMLEHIIQLVSELFNKLSDRICKLTEVCDNL